MEIKECMHVDALMPLKQRPKNKNKGKWFAFHKDYKDNIEYYLDLDKVLHGLGSQRKLDRYIKARPQTKETSKYKKFRRMWLSKHTTQ